MDNDNDATNEWETANVAMSDQLILVEALHTVACESEEAEIVRLALGALTNTQVGLQYLQSNPIGTR